MNHSEKYNIIFKGIVYVSIIFKRNAKIKDIIKEYFKTIKKENLLIKNVDNIYFISNCLKLDDFKEETLESILGVYNTNYTVNVLNSRENDYNYQLDEKKDKINKDANPYSSVYKAKKIKWSESEPDEYVAIKKIHKNILKEELKYKLVKDEITDEDFKPEIEKFNKELENMEMCQCEYSVKIYDYYDTKDEFIIIMELCDDNLFHLLTKTKNGFNSNQIKGILLQLNKVFKIMNEKLIAHRDIKLNNILIKYTNKEKTKFKVLLSDYGVSNRLSSLSRKLLTHAGNQLIMAPEILNAKPYNQKCDLWSLGVNIYLLYSKQFPYKGGLAEKDILIEIEQKGQSVLNFIPEKDKILKDLLSKLLVQDPEKRISWEEYFNHPFFKDVKQK